MFLFVPAKEELNNVEFGFRLSVSPAVADCFRSSASWPAVADWMSVFTCCGDGRCAWEAIYSASSPSSKSSSAVSTLWTSSLVQMAGIALAPTDCGGRDRGRSRPLELGVAFVIFNFLRVFSVKGRRCTILLRFNTTPSFPQKKKSALMDMTNLKHL